MKGLAVTLVLAVAASAIGAGPAAASPCNDLAALSRRLADNEWRRGMKALEPELHIEDARSSADPHTTPAPLSTVEVAIAHSSSVTELFGDGSGWTIWVEHVPSTDLYAAYTVQGTAYCQEEIVLRARADSPPFKIDGPPTYGGELCLTESADLGEFRGRPVFVTHGSLEQTTSVLDVQITPWTGSDWAHTCRLSLEFSTTYKIVNKYCHDMIACRGAGRVVQQIAQAYDREQEHSAGEEEFKFGKPVPASLQSRVSGLLGNKEVTSTPSFPTFGIEATNLHPWSYSDFTFFGLVLDGRPYVGGIGHEGVGWRANNNTLLAIYDARSSDLIPLASFIVSRSTAKLKVASVVPPKVERGP